MKLYLYTNMAGIVGWAKSAAEFRKANNLTVGYAVRVASATYEAPPGYTKTGRGLANDPAITEIGEKS